MTNSKLDRISGWAFAFLGALVTYGAWAMPRFDERGAALVEAPGLTPGLLGLFLTACGLVLALRPAPPGADQTGFWDGIAGTPANRRRALAALGLTLGYGAGLFGRVPFVPATMLFMFLFIVTFEIVLPAKDGPRRSWRIVGIAAIIAVTFSLATRWIFVELFLVQLP